MWKNKGSYWGEEGKLVKKIFREVGSGEFNHLPLPLAALVHSDLAVGPITMQ